MDMNNEWEKEWDSMFDWAEQVKEKEIGHWAIMYGFTPKDLKSFVTSIIASEQAHWRRSEIEELEGKLGTFGTEKGNSHCEVETCEVCQWNIGAYEGNNHALTSIITRYKEELLELEKGV